MLLRRHPARALKRRQLLVAPVLMAAVACGADPGESAITRGRGGEPVGDGLAGAIDIDGSSTVGPLTVAVAEEYAGVEPAVNVNLATSGTGGGFERFCGEGSTDISNASRPIEPEEAELCAENGIEYVEIQVGTDALTMVVNPAMDFVDCLTTDQVRAIFGPDDPAENWQQVDDAFPDQPLVVFGPDADSGTYDFMVEDVLDLESSRQDYQASADDNVIAQGVQGTRGAWGFFGFAFYQENQASLEALAYDAGDGCVEPTVETAQSGAYGMTRPLFLYVSTEALREQPQVADFVRFYLDHVNEVITGVGYIPAPDEALQASRQALEDAIAGAAPESGA